MAKTFRPSEIMTAVSRICRSLLPGILVLAVLVDGVNCSHEVALEADRPRRAAGGCISKKSKAKPGKTSPAGNQLEPTPAKSATVQPGGSNAAGVLPRSGPIPRGVGAMSRAEALARKFKLNIDSPTTRQVLNSLDDTVESFVSSFRKGAIRRELPGEVMQMTVEQALSHSTKVRKLLINSRFAK